MTDREKTIEALAKWFIGYANQSEDADRYMALRLLEHIEAGAVPGVGVDSGWVKCSERMPEDRIACLALVAGSKGPLVEHVYWMDEPYGWKSQRDHNLMWHVEDVKYWRELPKGPGL